MSGRRPNKGGVHGGWKTHQILWAVVWVVVVVVVRIGYEREKEVIPEFGCGFSNRIYNLGTTFVGIGCYSFVLSVRSVMLMTVAEIVCSGGGAMVAIVVVKNKYETREFLRALESSFLWINLL